MSDTELLRNSRLYQECLAEKDEILRHKWFESQKAGQDIGFDRAFLNWIMKHRDTWRREHRERTHAA